MNNRKRFVIVSFIILINLIIISRFLFIYYMDIEQKIGLEMIQYEIDKKIFIELGLDLNDLEKPNNFKYPNIVIILLGIQVFLIVEELVNMRNLYNDYIN